MAYVHIMSQGISLFFCIVSTDTNATQIWGMHRVFDKNKGIQNDMYMTTTPLL